MSTITLQSKYKINLFIINKKRIVEKKIVKIILPKTNEFYKIKSLKYDFRLFGWTHQGSNLGPPDYESGALTN